MGERDDRRTLGDVANDLRASAQVARRAIDSASGLGHFRDESVLELAQAVLMLNRAAARFDSVCGLVDTAWSGARKVRCPSCHRLTRDTTAGCDHCDIEDK